MPLVGQVYGTERVTLVQGDCLEVMRSLPDASVDAVITDPPYNAINRATAGLRLIDKGTADSLPIDIPALASEFIRIASGSVYVWCSDEQYTSWMLAFSSAGLTTRKCAWWKSNPSPMNGQYIWLSALELCVFARKPRAAFLRHCAHPVWKGPVERISGHPTPKPVWLMCEQVTASVPSNGTVLDPFMGSGSTGVAAVRTGRKFLGIEIDPTYCAVAKERLAKAELACVKQKET
jgi:site-specific DNA-methyltransferase (adenine-specific)